MKALEPWVVAPLETFLAESAARLTLLMTSSGQVVAQHGFSRSLDVMTAAALGAGIVASTEELARLMGATRFEALVHNGQRQSCMLSAFGTPRGRWIGLVVFGPETSVGIVRLFFDQMVQQLAVVAPREQAQPPMLAENFETELNAKMRADRETYDRIAKRVPAKRWGTPRDVAGLAVFLAGDASAYVNGQQIVVDGGLSITPF